MSNARWESRLVRAPRVSPSASRAYARVASPLASSARAYSDSAPRFARAARCRIRSIDVPVRAADVRVRAFRFFINVAGHRIRVAASAFVRHVATLMWQALTFTWHALLFAGPRWNATRQRYAFVQLRSGLRRQGDQ